MEHHGSTGTVAVCGNCGSCCTLLEIPSAGRLGSLGRGFHRQAEHRSSVAHLQNCGCLGVVVQVCLSAAFFTCCLWRLWWLAYGWHTLAARCPLGGLAVGHSEFCAVGSQLRQSPDELKDWSTSNGQHSGGCHSHAMAMHVSLLEGLKRPNWSQPKPKKEQDKLGLLVPHPKDNPIFPATEEFFGAMSCRLRERGRWRTNWPQRNTLHFLWMGTKWFLNDLHGNDSTTKHSRSLFVEKSLQLHWDSQLPLILRRKTKYATERGPWHGSDDLSLKTSNHAPD